MGNSITEHCALVLPGAVAKGAFEAGVIQVLAEKEACLDRIVATSSGALNGVAFAAGIRAGRQVEMADRLAEAWIENGGWQTSMAFSPLGWLKGRGLSNANGLLKMLRDLVTPNLSSVKRDVELRIIVAPLHGIEGKIGKRKATTYEKVLEFCGSDFDSEEGLEKIFAATTAACAFPGLYAPVELPELGPCVDGGAVNNAPIRYALDQADVDHIVMAVPFPEVMPNAGSMLGLGFINHLVEILINERLYRDLRDAEGVNGEVTRLEKLVGSGVLTESQLQKVKAALRIRRVHVTEVRPTGALKGNPFSGFFSKAERKRLVEEGRNAALAAIN